jgi:hypothetical protein|nr:MAG TPA: hypothetical protein [Caudoviricetes sp.]
MASNKYLNIFVLSFLDRLESIEHDLSYLKNNVNDPSRLEEAEKQLFLLKDKIKQIQNDKNILWQ